MIKPTKWAFVGDLQIPYEDKRAVALFLKVMKSWKPDVIDVVGDIDDQLEYSSFSDGTTDEFFNQIKAEEAAAKKAQALYDKAVAAEKEELPELPVVEPADAQTLTFVKKHADGAREFYTTLRKNHPNADIHASLGNHEMRVFKYLDKKAPQVIGEITPEFLWGLDNSGITWRMYDEPPLERYAGIHVHHGATTSSSGLAVKADIEAYNVSLVRGHDHRGGVVYKSHPLSKSSLVGMGTGHLCDPSAYGLRYTINPSWEQGFGIAYLVDGKAHLQFVPMRAYTVVLDGKVFVG